MKTVLFTIVASTLLAFTSKGQATEKKILKAGDDLSAVSSYLFPAFSSGTVTLPNGKLVSKMNFNLLTCQMQFIDPNGDTLNVAKPLEISAITFDSSSFFYNSDGYYEVPNTPGSVKLVVYRKVSYNPLKVGAFGVASHNGGGMDNYAALYTKSGDRRLLVNEDVEIVRKTTCYLLAPDGEKIKASKAAFFKLFPAKKDAIDKALATNKTDFNKEADLKKLLAVCQG